LALAFFFEISFFWGRLAKKEKKGPGGWGDGREREAKIKHHQSIDEHR
jgi:hypothetical protein